MPKIPKRGVKKLSRTAAKRRKKTPVRVGKRTPVRNANPRRVAASQYEADSALKEHEETFVAIRGFVYAAVVRRKNDWAIELAVEDLKAIPKSFSSSVSLRSGSHSSSPTKVKVYRVKRPRMRLLYNGKYRPAAGAESVGISGRNQDSTGTLGYGLTVATKSGPIDFIMTNWHVLLYNGHVGDPVMQPGPLDGGNGASDVIAQVRWGLFNGIVDVALAQIKPPTSTYLNLLKIKAPNSTYLTITGTASAQLNTRVWASCWKTSDWTGIVKSVNATTTVTLPDGGTKTFTNQIQVENNVVGLQPGDSGSALTDVHNKVVGLIFAGGGNIAMANKIEEINKAIQAAGL